jgi:hypothetical protein
MTNRKDRIDWDEPGADRDGPVPCRKRSRKSPVDEWDGYDDWREERGLRGRKRRDKAGGRHEVNRQRRSED